MKTIYELDGSDTVVALRYYLESIYKGIDGMEVRVSIDGENYLSADKVTILIITEDE
jgi:hypothetical protein